MMAYTGITNKTIQDYIGIVSLTNGNTTTEYLTGSTLFGICKTASGTAEKVVEVEDFTTFNPTHGLTIHVLFLYTNESNKPDATTPTAPTLKISSGGTAYPIYQFKGTAAGYTPSTSWRDGAIVPLTFIDARYDDDNNTAEGSNYWIMNSSIDTGADGLASVDLNNVQDADDLKAIEVLTGTSGYLKKTAANTWTLQTETDATSSVAGITTVGSTSGGAAAYDHTHGNITNDGKSITNAITGSNVAVTTSHKFLREDGSWEVPAYTTNTDQKVAQKGNNENKEFSILLKTTNDANNETDEVKFVNTRGKLVTINPSTSVITAPGGLIGNASTATNFSTAKTIALTGDITGSADGGASGGWSIATTISQGTVTNDMLAGSIAITKLQNYSITINGTSKELGQEFTLADLGLSSALRFIGTVASDSNYMPNEQSAGIPTISGRTTSYTPAIGDVVLDKDGNAEYVCTSITGTSPNFSYNWELLGPESSFALATAVINKSIFNGAYQLLYSTGEGAITVLNANTEQTTKFLSMTGTGSAGAAPTWSALTSDDIPDITYSKISDLSSWTGNNNITTVGTISSGTWQGTVINATYIGEHSTDKLTSGTLGYARGGTGQSSWAKGDILYANDNNSLSKLAIGTTAGYVLTVSNDGVPTWAENAATDKKVEQAPYNTAAQSSTKFNLLFKYDTGDTTVTNKVYYSTFNDKKLTFDAYDGTLSAAKFDGNGANITGITTDHIEGTGNGTKYLRQDGWKVVTVGVNADNTHGVVVTGVGFNQGTFPSLNNTGKAASFQVSSGILTITAGSDATLTDGTLPSLGTISKATLSINGVDL